MSTSKFCHLEDGDHVPHDYGNEYFYQPCGSSSRLVIGPSRDQTDLMIELAAELKGQPWFVLYVLLVPRRGNRQAGRYQSEPFQTHVELSNFLRGFKSFFEGDGRHHIWVGSASNDGTLVYDQHDTIFVYGPLAKFEEILIRRGFVQREFWFPVPHAHSYFEEYDAEEERLINEAEWKYFPLRDGDEM